ncbi:MAG: enoyl-CoA hydratase/isomerase family protein [Deltaproteobacteria bacterium]|nr:enoyl-CoA hydratase/isomerase family protein [Deltaproteobacteria bacterium]
MSQEKARETASGRVEFQLLDSGVAIVRLGSASERVVTITAERMNSLAEALEQVRIQRPKGVIITGPSPEMFTAGADINLIRDVKDPALGEKLARQGQEVFGLIEALPCPSVAAISGACVGGGCELSLACTYRIISDHKNSLIGLPEIKLGILPGFGGTQRLPRIIGLPKALDIILAGKTLRAQQALRYGLVSEIVPVDKLLIKAERMLIADDPPARTKVKFVDSLMTFNPIGRSFVRKKALQNVLKETKGFYPAPVAALESACHGLSVGLAEGLKHEAKELGRLIVTPESKSLVKIFFLTESAKAIGKSAKKAVEHVQAIVIGAGVMGAGIAGVLARNDCSVTLKDTSDAAVQRGMDHIKKGLSKLKYLGDQEKSFILNRIEATSKEPSNVGSATIAIEAIFEEMSAKKQVLGDLSKLMPPDAIVATNTSSLSVTEIAEAIEGPGRVVGMHFFNPVEKMPLVEIVRAQKTSDKTLVIVAALASKLGKHPIIVSDVPGFLVNRILTPYLNEAAFLLEEGYSIESIDKAATAFGMPMGPIRLLDEVGLDVAVHVQETMIKGYGERMKSPAFAKAMVEAKRFGRKSGAGFYDFKDSEATPHANVRAVLGITKPAQSPKDLQAITSRLVLSLINEAVLCLDEGVAGTPGSDAANQIDLGTVMGMGFPPFRGGLMHYASSVGAKTIYDGLSKLEQAHGKRFAIAPGIRSRAESGKSFYQAA